MASVAAHASVAALFLTHDAVPVETGEPIVVEIVAEVALPASNAVSQVETNAAAEADTNTGALHPPTDGAAEPETGVNPTVAPAPQEVVRAPVPETPPSPVLKLEPIAQEIAALPPPSVALPIPPRRPARPAAPMPDPAPQEPEPTERAEAVRVGPPATDKDPATRREVTAHKSEPTKTQAKRATQSAALGGQRTEALAASGNPRPPYPARAVRRGLEGRVILDVEVLATGRVGEIKVAKSSGHGLLDRTAVKGIRKWLFKPAKLAGIDVRSRVRVPVRFELEN